MDEAGNESSQDRGGGGTAGEVNIAAIHGQGDKDEGGGGEAAKLEAEAEAGRGEAKGSQADAAFEEMEMVEREEGDDEGIEEMLGAEAGHHEPGVEGVEAEGAGLEEAFDGDEVRLHVVLRVEAEGGEMRVGVKGSHDDAAGEAEGEQRGDKNEQSEERAVGAGGI